MKYLMTLISAYLVGTLNPAYIIGRIKGFDIRRRGSGNAGGSNALIVMGKAVGIFCILFDIFKAFAVVMITKQIFKTKMLMAYLSAVFCILGHMFPCFMKFCGGKGLACMGGSILAFDPLIFVIMLAVELILAFWINYLVVVPVSASLAAPVIFSIKEGTAVVGLIMAIVSAAVLIKHFENLRNIRKGTELRLSYLWNRDREIDRVLENGFEEN